MDIDVKIKNNYSFAIRKLWRSGYELDSTDISTCSELLITLSDRAWAINIDKHIIVVCIPLQRWKIKKKQREKENRWGKKKSGARLINSNHDQATVQVQWESIHKSL